MIKYTIFIVTFLWITTGITADVRYYRLHPHALQTVLQACPKPPSIEISCEQLANIAAHLNAGAQQLRSNPQGYGKKILSLQEAIAKQESMLHTSTLKTDLQSSLNDNRQRLQERLAIVKWLESPEG